MLSLICALTNDWANRGDAGDLIRHRAHYDVTVIQSRRIWWLHQGLIYIAPMSHYVFHNTKRHRKGFQRDHKCSYHVFGTDVLQIKWRLDAIQVIFEFLWSCRRMRYSNFWYPKRSIVTLLIVSCLLLLLLISLFLWSLMSSLLLLSLSSLLFAASFTIFIFVPGILIIVISTIVCYHYLCIIIIIVIITIIICIYVFVHITSYCFYKIIWLLIHVLNSVVIWLISCGKRGPWSRRPIDAK